MHLYNLQDFSKIFGEKNKFCARILGIDYGQKNLGIAISDANMLIANPLCLIKRAKVQNDIETIVQIIKTHDVKCIIIGWPLEMDGNAGQSCGKIVEFVEEFFKNETFVKNCNIPIFKIDERFSTKACYGQLCEGNFSRANKKGKIDAMAAAYFTQNAIDYIKMVCKNFNE